MRLPFGETVTVQRWGRDIKGNRTLLSEHQIRDVGFAPTGGTSGWGVATDENNVRGETVNVGETLYMPFDADIDARDTVILPDGRVFEVDGAPARHKSPLSGWAPGAVVNLKRVEG